MSAFDKDDYLSGMDEAESLKGDTASSGRAGGSPGSGSGQSPDDRTGRGRHAARPAEGQASSAQAKGRHQASATDAEASDGDGAGRDSGQGHEGQAGESAGEDDLTPLGKAKKEAADYLDALQRERAEFVNFRNRTKKEQDLFRQHGIIDVLTALLPALDDIDRIREHGQMDDSFQAVATKIDKTFEKFGVEKFGEKGEDFDPTRHEAILHKSDSEASKETVDTVVEAGYRIGDRVIRAARVVVASPEQ